MTDPPVPPPAITAPAITAALREADRLGYERISTKSVTAMLEAALPHLAAAATAELKANLQAAIDRVEHTAAAAQAKAAEHAVAAEREACAQLAEQEASQRGSIVAEDALCQFAAQLRDGQPPPAKRDEIAQRAEEIHAEHHPGYIVPSLDSCPEHTRAEYEQRAAALLRETRP